MEFTKEEIKAATNILQKHVPNRYPLFNNWVNAMQDYAKWYHEQQVKILPIADVVKRYLAIGTLGSGKSFRYVDTADTMKCFVEYLNEIYPDFDIDAVIEV